ncbi:hypothetical protein D3C85_531750 [compost metagenome]
MTYSWSPSGGTGATATGLTAGAYTCTITDANLCSITKNFTITEPLAIDKFVSVSSNTLTVNQTGATYQWFDCANALIPDAIGQSFLPTANGSYKVEISLNGCTISSDCVLITTLATTDFETKSKFLMYPNPSKGTLNILSDTDGDFKIVNQLGQTVKTFKVTNSTTNMIDLEYLNNGIYFIQGTNGTKITTGKLVIKK